MRIRRTLDPLMALPCFRDLAHEEAAMLLRNVDTVLAGTGESFWAMKATGCELILVIQGELTATGRGSRTFRPGMIAGALPMLDRTRSPYVVRTTRPSRLGFMSRAQLHATLSASSALTNRVGAAVLDDLNECQATRC